MNYHILSFLGGLILMVTLAAFKKQDVINQKVFTEELRAMIIKGYASGINEELNWAKLEGHPILKHKDFDRRYLPILDALDSTYVDSSQFKYVDSIDLKLDRATLFYCGETKDYSLYEFFLFDGSYFGYECTTIKDAKRWLISVKKNCENDCVQYRMIEHANRCRMME